MISLFTEATRRQILAGIASLPLLLLTRCETPSTAGWVKYAGNPVLGGSLGTCFDVCVLLVGESFWMWFSWRPRRSIALTKSYDGIHWSRPIITLGPDMNSGWEWVVNRPVVVLRDRIYHMWYTGQTATHSAIGYARSKDGANWQRASNKPVLSPSVEWEQPAVMAPHVMWDEDMKIYRMWYSGGGQYEPNSIGYASSNDGAHWTRDSGNPVMRPDSHSSWERARVAGAQVLKHHASYYMFYIGFQDLHHAAIGLARSSDGINNWERHPNNPIIRPGFLGWDRDSCYKPFAIYVKDKWMLWYNGRAGYSEQIGLATHMHEDLGFR